MNYRLLDQQKNILHFYNYFWTTISLYYFCFHTNAYISFCIFDCLIRCHKNSCSNNITQENCSLKLLASIKIISDYFKLSNILFLSRAMYFLYFKKVIPLSSSFAFLPLCSKSPLLSDNCSALTSCLNFPLILNHPYWAGFLRRIFFPYYLKDCWLNKSLYGLK